ALRQLRCAGGPDPPFSRRARRLSGGAPLRAARLGARGLAVSLSALPRLARARLRRLRCDGDLPRLRRRSAAAAGRKARRSRRDGARDGARGSAADDGEFDGAAPHRLSLGQWPSAGAGYGALSHPVRVVEFAHPRVAIAALRRGLTRERLQLPRLMAGVWPTFFFLRDSFFLLTVPVRLGDHATAEGYRSGSGEQP